MINGLRTPAEGLGAGKRSIGCHANYTERQERPGGPGRSGRVERKRASRQRDRPADGGIAVTLPVPGFLPPMLFSGDFLWAAIVLFVVAIVAGVLGLRGIAGVSMEIARIFVIIFIVLAVIALIL